MNRRGFFKCLAAAGAALVAGRVAGAGTTTRVADLATGAEYNTITMFRYSGRNRWEAYAVRYVPDGVWPMVLDGVPEHPHCRCMIGDEVCYLEAPHGP